jgi:hypothetical protein
MAGTSDTSHSNILALTIYINSKQEADEVYRLGIARKAEPLDHLESRYQDFQRRMISTHSASAADTTNSQPARPKRQALATAKAPSGTPAPSRAAGARSTAEPLPAAATSSRPGFQIFVDPSGEGGELGEVENEWHDLGTRKTRVKENIPETKKLAGTTIKQAGKAKRVASASSGSSSASKIVPFKDPVDPPAPARKSASSSKVASAKGTPEPSAPTRKSSGKAFAPFIDDQEPTSAPAHAKPTSKAFLPFVDEEKPSAVPPVKKPSTKGFVPFVDQDETSAEASNPAPPPTPKFVPFRDEASKLHTYLIGFSLSPLQDEAEPARSTPLVGDSVIKVKQSNVKAPVPSSEAEALRKDPLKNYDS